MTTETAATTEFLPADPSAGAPRRWLALPVLLTGAFLPILDFNVVNLALPAIRSDLGASSGEVQFVISAYAATYAVFLITGAALEESDIAGRVRAHAGQRLTRCAVDARGERRDGDEP